MAIYTRFGSPVVSIEWFNERTGDVMIVTRREADKRLGRETSELHYNVTHSSNLKADGGINEIVESAKEILNLGPKPKGASR